jgi:hypothetical protein
MSLTLIGGVVTEVTPAVFKSIEFLRDECSRIDIELFNMSTAKNKAVDALNKAVDALKEMPRMWNEDHSELCISALSVEKLLEELGNVK